MADKLTVHMIANAHIDPVWMWTWPAGVDEVINTCRTSCDLLDQYPELVVSRGEAWVYEQIRTLCPDLFERIRRFVEAGRWEVLTAWWVQADTNMAGPETLIKQGQIGRAWFKEHLGLDVTIACEVDRLRAPRDFAGAAAGRRDRQDRLGPADRSDQPAAGEGVHLACPFG